MKCPNCNVSVLDNSKYCPRCGILFDSDDVKKYTEMFDIDLLEIYFPNKKLKFHVDRLSLPYMLFTYHYASYKKMYKEALYSFITQVLIYFLLILGGRIIKDSIGFMFFPVLFIIIGSIVTYFYYVFNFDRLLIENRKMRLNKIVSNNKEKSEEDIINLLRNDSKNSIKGLIITIIIDILIIIFLIL